MLDARKLDRIWNDIDPRVPVPAEDPLHWYADLSAGRGEMDFAERMALTLRRARRPLRLAILGHMGSGKSTELARLKHLLESEPAGRPLVLQLLVDQELDREDLDAADIQLLLLERLLHHLLTRGGELSESLAGRLSVWLETSTGGSDLAGLHDAVAVLRRDVQLSVERRGLLRRRTQEELRARLDVLREVGALVAATAHRPPPCGLVVLVDGVEKVALLPEGRERARRILLDKAEQWDSLGVSLVFTAPLSLIEEDQRLANLFDWHQMVPALPVVGRDGQSEGAEAPEYVLRARAALRALLEARVPDLNALFASPAVFEDCLTRSAGSVRDLFRLLRECIDEVLSRAPNGGVIEARDLERAWRHHARQLVISLREPDLERLRKLKWDQGDFLYDQLGVSLLQRELVLPYENGGRWFALHPALRERVVKG